MNYTDQIAPELKKYAKSVPFNRQLVSVCNIYQADSRLPQIELY